PEPQTIAPQSIGRQSAGPALNGSAVLEYPRDELIADFRLACLSRALDDRELILQTQSRGFFQIAGAGHEALCLGLAHSLRAGHDWFLPYYRDRALMLALGVTPTEMLLQAVGSGADKASGGRQMPCHWGNKDLHVLTASSPTGTQCLPAVGCAEAGRYIGDHAPLPGCSAQPDEVTYVSLGDGATSEGEFWESLNTACNLRLPVLYVVADNGWAISVPASQQTPAPVCELARPWPGLAVHALDGRDYFASRALGARVIEAMRAGAGPALIHATVTRPYSHSASDTQAKYRGAADLADEAAHDPILLMEQALIERGVLDEDAAAAIWADTRRVALAAAFEALAAPRPDPASVTEHVWVLPEVGEAGGAGLSRVGSGHGGDGEADSISKKGVAMGEAIRLALAEVMGADERVRVFGEDVADASEELLGEVDGKGGVFGTTLGLQRTYGSDRCYNTPLAEANIIGRAVGQAMRGLRPCPEIQFFDYIWPAMSQLKSEASTVRWRSAGMFSCPMVVRVPIGGYLTGGAIWHSQSGESIFVHTPGILVAFPSRASDAAGLLRASFACEDPVLFLEHKHLLRQAYTRDPLTGPGHLVGFGKGRYVTRGTDATVVTYGATVQRSVLAAARLEGASVEIIDLRSLVPWDSEMVAESVARTGRVLVVHEDSLTCGFGAEVAAWVAEHCFGDLDAPVRRVGAKDTLVAYEPTLEAAILPQVGDIATALDALLEY
ncbi:MAG: alpha-ketoacid dehydrogenase subunit alpha/beta, partial [Acidimicrobiales bacterium]